MSTEKELIATATMRAVLATAQAEGLEVPERIAADIARLEVATDQRVTKITAGATAPKYVPNGPLPRGVAGYQWQTERLTGDLEKRGWPGVQIVEPMPCYVLHVSSNGITAQSWLREAGYEADSNAPFRCTLREIK